MHQAAVSFQGRVREKKTGFLVWLEMNSPKIKEPTITCTILPYTSARASSKWLIHIDFVGREKPAAYWFIWMTETSDYSWDRESPRKGPLFLWNSSLFLRRIVVHVCHEHVSFSDTWGLELLWRENYLCGHTSLKREAAIFILLRDWFWVLFWSLPAILGAE